MSSAFCLACFWASFPLQQVSVACYFLLLSIIPLFVCITFCLSTHQLADTWIVLSLGLLPICCHDHMHTSLYREMCFHFLWVMLGSRICFTFFFFFNCQTLCKVDVPFYILTCNVWGLHVLCIVSLLIKSLSGYVVLSHFILRFRNNERCWSFFSYAY